MIRRKSHVKTLVQDDTSDTGGLRRSEPSDYLESVCNFLEPRAF